MMQCVSKRSVPEEAPTLRSWAWGPVAGCVLVFGLSCVASAGPATTVYVLRHAEKGTGPNPALTANGARRANSLAHLLEDHPVAAVFTSPYRRTRQTVAPLASSVGLTPEVLPADAVPTLVRQILRNYRGRTVVVVGHSNTVPRMLRQLGVADAVVLQADDYGDLFVVRIDANGAARLERRRFGP